MAGSVKKLILGDDGTVAVVVEAGDLALADLPMQLTTRIGGMRLTLYPTDELGGGDYLCTIQPKWKEVAKQVCMPGAAVEADQ